MKAQTSRTIQSKKTKAKPNRRSENRRERIGLISNLIYDVRHNPFLWLLCLPAIVWFLVFSYTPLTYLIVAFKKYSIVKGLWGSDWVGIKNFKAFFGSDQFWHVTVNTLYLNVLFILTTMFFSILIAVSLSELSSRSFKKITQSIVILPYFISWTIVAMIFDVFLQTDKGVINQVLVSLGFERIKFYQNADVWPMFLVFLRIWKGAGYGSIVYLATITGMDQEMFEAAKIDGATRWQSIRFITLPLLKTTAVMLLIMNVGGIFTGDFGMVFNLVGPNSMLFRTTDNINTYTYRMLMESNNIGQSSAVSLWQSVMSFLMVIVTNAIARKVDEDSALF